MSIKCPDCNITIPTNPNYGGGSTPLYPTTCPTCGKQIGYSTEDEPIKSEKRKTILLILIFVVILLGLYLSWEYTHKGIPNDQAIELKLKSAQAYCNRGITYAKQWNYDQAIPEFTKAIEINPNYAEAYNFRAITYFRLQEYSKAWADVYKAEELGVTISPEFLEELKRASGREK